MPREIIYQVASECKYHLNLLKEFTVSERLSIFPKVWSVNTRAANSTDHSANTSLLS